MQKNVLVKLSSLIIFAFLASQSCVTEVGNPDNRDPEPVAEMGATGLDLKIIGIKPDSLTSAANDQTSLDITDKSGQKIGTIELSEALLVLDNILLIKKNSEGGNTIINASSDSPKQHLINLLDNKILPPLEIIPAEPGFYSRIQILLKAFLRNNLTNPEFNFMAADNPLIGNSIYFKGLYYGLIGNEQVTAMECSFVYSFTEVLDLSNSYDNTSVFELTANYMNYFVIEFELQKWFDFTGAAYDFTDLTPHDRPLSFSFNDKSQGAKSESAKIFRNNIINSIRFGKDKDKDGNLKNEMSEMNRKAKKL